MKYNQLPSSTVHMLFLIQNCRSAYLGAFLYNSIRTILKGGLRVLILDASCWSVALCVLVGLCVSWFARSVTKHSAGIDTAQDLPRFLMQKFETIYCLVSVGSTGLNPKRFVFPLTLPFKLS